MSNNPERKKHVNLTPKLFEMIRNHYKTEKIGNLCSLTGLSRSRIYDLIDKIREIGPRMTFNDVKKKRGRIKIDKSECLTDIRLEVGRDTCNSLTQIALKNIFEKGVSMSLSFVNRAVAASGRTRKRTNKRPNVVLSDEHRTKVSRFASEMEALFDHRVLFLDESGFNLHTSNKYWYSIPDTYAIDYNIGNRGKNVSLCSILAARGIIYIPRQLSVRLVIELFSNNLLLMH